jgi:predicted ATPase
MTEDLFKYIDENDPRFTFLVGTNGSGKTQRLSSLATELLDSGHRVIAVANTVFDRFPRSRNPRFGRVSPSNGQYYVIDVFKRAIISSQGETSRNSVLIGKALEYTGFNPVIGVHVRLTDNIDYSGLLRLLSENMPERDVSGVLRAFDIYKNYANDRHSAWIDMFGKSVIGPDRRDILILLKYESKLKKMKLLESIAITLEKGNSIYDLSSASSGELSLLATYAYIATNINEGTVILIDEPENSLHPRWQWEYCERLLDQFYLYSPKFVIATHSPHIVQGAQRAKVEVHLMKMNSGETTSAMSPKSIEGTLYEVFGVLSPANHYLSEKVAFILNEVVQNRQTLADAQAELSELRKLSNDPEQREFLLRAEDLALTVKAKILSQTRES